LKKKFTKPRSSLSLVARFCERDLILLPLDSQERNSLKDDKHGIAIGFLWVIQEFAKFGAKYFQAIKETD
jgi:hypothetical protein